MGLTNEYKKYKWIMNKKPIVYICHPISGDVEANLCKIKKIYADILMEGNVIPFAPYLGGLSFLNDAEPKHREMGIELNKAFFRRKAFDVLWIYGDISKGMAQEIMWCEQYEIEVFFMDNVRLEFTKREIRMICDGLMELSNKHSRFNNKDVLRLNDKLHDEL
jgi:hypothetical protein